MKISGRLVGAIVVFILGIVIATANPWAPALDPLGHKVLMGLI